MILAWGRLWMESRPSVEGTASSSLSLVLFRSSLARAAPVKSIGFGTSVVVASASLNPNPLRYTIHVIMDKRVGSMRGWQWQ